MSPAGSHGKKVTLPKLRRTGRHAVPTPLGKLARRAAPAIALAGALAVVPLLAQGGSPSDLSDSLASPHRVSTKQHGASHDRTRVHAASKKAPRPKHSAAKPHHAATPRPRKAQAHSPKPTPSPTPTARMLSCSGTSYLLPQNYEAIVRFLMGHGYTGLAAAGIAGNIYRESMGNPESVGTGGGGLIGWTPLPAGFVTGNPAADLQTQLDQLLVYNEQWAQYIPQLNAATSATQAAYIYMAYFERPGVPAASEREGAAAAVAAACHF